MLWTAPGASYETQGGFVDTASGAFTPDPASVMLFDNVKDLTRTPDQPYLYGTPGDSNVAASSYDASQHRWLPVPPQAVSPDGKTYAYGVARNAPGGGVHVVEVATGVDRILSTAYPPNVNYFVVGYLSDGIYLNEFGPTGGGGIGLLRLDPATGAITQVSTDSPALGVLVGETPLQSPPSTGNPDAWWTTDSDNFTDISDPYVYFQYLTGVPGQHGEDWFSRPGLHPDVIGADTTGQAIVAATSAAQLEVWLLGTPNSSTEIYHIQANGTDRAFKTAVADKGGWWIGSISGVFFATASTWVQVSSTAAVVVGGCA